MKPTALATNSASGPKIRSELDPNGRAAKVDDSDAKVQNYNTIFKASSSTTKNELQRYPRHRETRCHAILQTESSHFPLRTMRLSHMRPFEQVSSHHTKTRLNQQFLCHLQNDHLNAIIAHHHRHHRQARCSKHASTLPQLTITTSI